MLQNLIAKVRELLRSRRSQINNGLDKAERAISARTGGKYDDRVSSIRQRADDALNKNESAAPEASRDKTDPDGTAGRSG